RRWKGIPVSLWQSMRQETVGAVRSVCYDLVGLFKSRGKSKRVIVSVDIQRRDIQRHRTPRHDPRSNDPWGINPRRNDPRSDETKRLATRRLATRRLDAQGVSARGVDARRGRPAHRLAITAAVVTTVAAGGVAGSVALISGLSRPATERAADAHDGSRAESDAMTSEVGRAGSPEAPELAPPLPPEASASPSPSVSASPSKKPKPKPTKPPAPTPAPSSPSTPPSASPSLSPSGSTTPAA
ncbi:MAG: hypothetical protein ACRDTQ_04325, partial [Micromonosporaceae bacterium]